MFLYAHSRSGGQRIKANMTADFVSHPVFLDVFSGFPRLLPAPKCYFLDTVRYGYSIFSILWVSLRQTGGH